MSTFHTPCWGLVWLELEQVLHMLSQLCWILTLFWPLACEFQSHSLSLFPGERERCYRNQEGANQGELMGSAGGSYWYISDSEEMLLFRKPTQSTLVHCYVGHLCEEVNVKWRSHCASLWRDSARGCGEEMSRKQWGCLLNICGKVVYIFWNELPIYRLGCNSDVFWLITLDISLAV